MKSALGLFGRASRKDAVAPTPDQPAGERAAVPEAAPEGGARPEDASPPTPEAVLDAMHDVIDPELGYNIVDIGLIYEVHVDEGVVRIVMTMTTPGCPAQDYIIAGVQQRAARIPGVREIAIKLVWEPSWSPRKMTPVARAHLRIPDDGA